jgi:Ca-activated chloride channel family protein
MFHPVRSISFRAVLLFLLTSAGVYSQTSIDDVHVVPRTTGIEMATATAGPRLSGAGLIRTSTELVMVPVTITDDMNRPVTGLDRDNFQLFENKQAQEIKDFTSEDSPVSIGIIMDVSGSMSDKMARARDAVHQFCEASNPQDEFFMVTFWERSRKGARPF